MIYSSKAIVLSHMKYAESSVITHIYTREKGLQSFLINGVRKKKARIRAALLQAFSLVEIEAYHKQKGGLQRLKEIKPEVACMDIYVDDIKRSLSLFLSELVSKCLHEDIPDPIMFDFIWNAVQWLENTEQNCANFHLIFMAQFSKYLGIMPLVPTQENYNGFLMHEGLFTQVKSTDIYCINPPLLFKFVAILGSNFDGMESVSLTKTERAELLDTFITFFKLQIEGFSDIKSLKILSELFYQE